MEDFSVLVRPAVAADYDHFVRFFAELGVDDPVPDESHWKAMLPQTLIAEHSDTPIGYAFANVLKDVGYVRHVVVDPLHRRRRVGQTLMVALAERFRAAGCTSWRLNVKTDNFAAQRLYEMLGLRAAYRSAVLRIHWDAAETLPLIDRPLEVHAIPPSDDAALEAMFDLPSGQLADHRLRKDQVLLRIANRASSIESTLGLASFSPSFPGAFPFRVMDPAALRPLLQALHPYARPTDSEVNLVIENDDATAAVLRRAGAVLRTEVFHYRGQIPSCCSNA